MPAPERALEGGTEEAEVPDAPDPDLGRADALHDLGGAAIEAMERLDVARGHELVVRERQREQRRGHLRITPAGLLPFRPRGVFGVQAPAAPLADDAAGQIPDLAQALPGEVAPDPGGQRHGDVPQPPGPPAQAGGVLQPVAAARRDRDDAGEAGP